MPACAGFCTSKYRLGYTDHVYSCELLFRLTPQTKKIREKQLKGEFDFSPETKAYIETVRQSKSDHLLEGVLAKLKLREEQKNEKEKPWNVDPDV